MHPELRGRVFDLRERLADELPRGRAAWRVHAVYRAWGSLLEAGGMDLAASLAYR